VKNKRQLRQIGSTTVFFIVGIILTITLICAVYSLKQRGEQVRKEQAIAAYDSKLAADKKATEKAAESKTIAKNNDTSSGLDSSGSENTSISKLPETGLSITSDEIIGIGLLVMSISYYFLSRRYCINRSL
jgi:LPXTG-motif cell wall-anchored protein